MLLPVFLLFLCAIAASGIHALAIPAVETTSADSKCIDLTHCRTVLNIIWSSLATIFACTWVFIHRDVPNPNSRRIDVILERIRITIWALLVPEYIVAWAIRQWIVAHEISKEFSEKHEAYGGGFGEQFMQTTATTTSQETTEDKEPPGLWSRFTSTAARLCRTSGNTVAKPWEVPHRAFRKRFPKRHPWTLTHGFFVLMGGFYYFEGNEPRHPASRADLEVTINVKPLPEMPTEPEIKDRSKGDGFSKTVTIMQTVWFVAQCIARAIQGLTIANLEIVTLAYTAIIMAIYYFWWSKPLSVSSPIRLPSRPGTAGPDCLPGSSGYVGWKKQLVTQWVNVAHVSLKTNGDEDMVNLSQLAQVPTFYAGGTRQSFFADAIAMIFAMIFGAVHCIAWSFAFPSHAEKLLWRISAVAVVGVPVIYFVFLVVTCFLSPSSNSFEWVKKWMPRLLLILCAVGIFCYLLGRIVLLVLAFTTLRDLPPTAYETVHWMTFIPHV